MSIRVGFDVDGVIANFNKTFRETAANIDPGSGAPTRTDTSSRALAADAARRGPTVQASFAEAVEGMAGALADYLARKPSRGKRARARRERALQMLSELVGALVLARAVAAADPALSDEILAANRRGLR